MRLSRKGIENIKRGLRRSWEDGTHRKLQQEREVDADTMRSRALYDRKGKLLVSGVAIYHSTRRIDQYDVFINGRLAFTGGPRVLSEWITRQAQNPQTLFTP